jgi:biopolymer transport protein ExbB/TolQ
VAQLSVGDIIAPFLHGLASACRSLTPWFLLFFRYAGILQLPQKRAEVKKKVRNSSKKVSAEVEEAMQKDLAEELERMANAVEALIAPYRQAALEEAERVRRLEAQISEIDAELRTARSKVRRFGE